MNPELRQEIADEVGVMEKSAAHVAKLLRRHHESDVQANIRNSSDVWTTDPDILVLLGEIQSALATLKQAVESR